MDSLCKEEERLKEFENKLKEEKKKINKEKFYYDIYEKRVVYSENIRKVEEEIYELEPIKRTNYILQKIVMIVVIIIGIVILILINK